jgi:flagellar biosynthesis/type III secretory pathway M-ring protein FliF/YscJ
VSQVPVRVVTQFVTQPDPDSVTPGVAGFLVVFVLALVTWLLMRNLTGRLRRLRYREDERLAAEGSAAQAADHSQDSPEDPAPRS